MLQLATNTDVFRHYPYCGATMTFPDLDPKTHGLIGTLFALLLVFLKMFSPQLSKDISRLETKIDAIARDLRENAADVRDIDRRVARMEGQGD